MRMIKGKSWNSLPSQSRRTRIRYQPHGIWAPQSSEEADVTKFFMWYESLLSPTGTNPAADGDIALFPYYCCEVIKQTMMMMNG
jgi:hypothetical protein